MHVSVLYTPRQCSLVHVQIPDAFVYISHELQNLLSPRHVVQQDYINASTTRHAQSIMWPKCSNDQRESELCIKYMYNINFINRNTRRACFSRLECKFRKIWSFEGQSFFNQLCIYIYIFPKLEFTKSQRVETHAAGIFRKFCLQITGAERYYCVNI